MAAPPGGLPSEAQLAALTAAPIALSVEAEQAAADAATALQALEAARSARAAAKRRQREAADAALESAEHRHASEREAADLAAAALRDPQALWEAGERYMMEERWPEAVAAFARSAPVQPAPRGQARCHNAAGLCLLLAVRLEEALLCLNLAIATEPGDPRAWHNRSQVHFFRRDFAKAAQDVQEALRLEEGNEATQELLARAVRWRDDAAAAEREQQALAVTPLQAGEAWRAAHASWAAEVRRMLAALAPNPEDEAEEDEDDEEEPAVPQIELPQPTGAALAGALVKHQKGARCEARLPRPWLPTFPA